MKTIHSITVAAINLIIAIDHHYYLLHCGKTLSLIIAESSTKI